jgi:hypothetical protein
MRRRAILVGVCLLAVLAGLFLLRPWDPLEAARRRVRLGMDEAAVAAALGLEESENVFGGVGPDGEPRVRTLCRTYDAGFLLVKFDKSGKVAWVEARRTDRTLRERIRAWWPW